MLGHLKSRNPNINGLTGEEWNPIQPLSAQSQKVKVSFDAESVIGVNPAHQVDSTAEQIWGSRVPSYPSEMTGFIAASNSTRVMRCYNFSTVPAISTLALGGALFDAFFSSVPGPTGPNRMFFHSGTSHGAALNIADLEIVGYPQRSFYMDLEMSRKSWGVYFEDFPVTLELADVRLFLDRFHIMSDFLRHAREGKLPDYSFLEPRWEG
jgi:phospholipase C